MKLSCLLARPPFLSFLGLVVVRDEPQERVHLMENI